jgi:hypothetical protein
MTHLGKLRIMKGAHSGKPVIIILHTGLWHCFPQCGRVDVPLRGRDLLTLGNVDGLRHLSFCQSLYGEASPDAGPR